MALATGLPETATALNVWIQSNFQVFTGPPRAYFELPILAVIGDDEATVCVEHPHRIAYLILGFKGSEEETCKAVAAWLASVVTREARLDALEPLFIRHVFEYRKDAFGETLSGRLAFWRNSLNRKLMGSPCFKLTGAESSLVKYPPDFFDRQY